MPPGGPAPQPALLARHVLGNPAYAVRYAHAAAAAVLRWAASLGSAPDGFQPRLLMAPRELALLDTLSWLPERVAMAARRGRPDEFAGYLVELAARTIDTMSTTGFTTIPTIAPNDCGWRTRRGPGWPPGWTCSGSARRKGYRVSRVAHPAGPRHGTCFPPTTAASRRAT